ncbi:T9SS type A sorting domain-containing protein [Hymenobacter caeli]|uniref:T9SS type A sorting domain-containing protein n=1 Tax=Hymenobacter caeli TaxID=2735894 RepID=A0ABX2FMF7_9BACT|nr:T9SS type A sorting domain-containing protein [Hymenobacter caeli]NRT18330.1 hypothetical protein [Hymenobacter caeli]
MYYSNSTSAFTRQRLVCVLVLLLASATHAWASAFYSNNVVGQSNSSLPLNNVLGLLSTSSVVNANNAADADLSNYATLVNGLVTNPFLRLGLSGAGQPGDRAGVLLAPVKAVLGVTSLNLAGGVIITTYLGGTQQEAQVVSASVLAAALTQTNPSALEFIASKAFDQVQVAITGAGVGSDLRLYYAYSVSSLTRPTAKGLVSEFPAGTTDLTPYYSTAGTGTDGLSVCVNTGVTNPQNAVSNSPTDYAQFNSLVGVSCPSTLRVNLAGGTQVPAGYYAGFVVGGAGLLDASALSGLRLSTSLNGVPTGDSFTGVGVLELKLLPDGKQEISFPSTKPFNQVTISRASLLSVLDNLQLYYGFGVEPAAFTATTNVLSKFASPAGQYQVFTGGDAITAVPLNACGTVTINGDGSTSNCGVTNPQNAANSGTTSPAMIGQTVGLNTDTALRLNLNNPDPTGTNPAGAAGSRAGMVVGMGSGLLDASSLAKMTVSTYDKNGKLLESASGASLLSLDLLPNGRQEISFNTTQSFASVQLTAASGLALSSNLSIYNAFADNRGSGLPTIILPLPVVLTAFAGHRTATGADLNWATASEHNSSLFVVERRAGTTGEFQAVGQVAAAGTSTAPIRYQYADASAASLTASVLYYRLRQVDIDGTTAYSPVVALAAGALAQAAGSLQVYPNPAPASAAVSLRCDAATAGGTAIIYSELGQLVRQLPLPTEAGAALTLPTLPGGLYHVVVRDGAGHQVAAQRLVVAQ